MNQKLSDWASIAEIVSSVAVVVTLIILIIEIRGNSEAVRADMLANIAGRTHTHILGSISNPALVEALSKEAQGDELSFAEQFILNQAFGAQMKLAEESFIAFRDGHLDEEVWLTRAEVVLDNFAGESDRRRWANRRESGWYVQEFTDYMDSELSKRYGE